MRDLPSNWSQDNELLTVNQLNNSGSEALRELEAKGFKVYVGLTKELAQQIIEIARQPSIKEYCPRDYGQRFKDLTSVEEWLAKKRGVFTLVKSVSGGDEVFGYGWVGEGESKHVAGGQVTFAVRLSESAQGQGLATPFSQVIIQGGSSLFGAANIWLETWQSNGGAVHIYHKIGFNNVASKQSDRPTVEGQSVKDERLFMKLPNELLR